MKKISYIIFLFFFTIISYSNADEIIFDTAEIQISDNGNIITALDGEANSVIDKIKITGKKFVYDKLLSSLSASGNLIIENKEQSIQIESKKIFYDLKNKIIFSKEPSIINDNFGNRYFVNKFNYDISKSVIKINDAKIIDKDKNTINLKLAFLNLTSNKLLAKDILVNLNSIFYNEENNTRIAGNSLVFENDKSIISKGVFTTCKKNDDCPPWQLSAKKITHDKIKKTIYYDNAWLKLYDRPIFYFPKFFHPDPTVKRRSGFLIPTTSDSSSTGTSVNLPYYHVLSDNKDFTVRPRVYFQNKQLIQSEYREVNKNSSNTTDFSLLNDGGQTRNHFFSKFTRNLDLDIFEESKIDFQLQQTSGDTYLKTYKLKSPLIEDNSVLTSSLSFDGFNEDTSLYIDMRSYENLALKKSDRFEFISPNYRLNKRIFKENSYNGNFNLSSNGYSKNYDTNKFEHTVINNFDYASNSKINKYGFKNNTNVFLKNSNKKTRDPSKYIDNDAYRLASLFEYKSSYPLIKEASSGSKNLLIPSSSFKFSPNTTRPMRNDESRIDINNVFNPNRINSEDTFEGGASLTLGTEFLKINKDNDEILNVKLANSIRYKEDKNLPIMSSIGKKTSDLFGQIEFNPNEIFEFNYDFSLDENLQNQNYQLIKTSMTLNNFVTSFSFLNEDFDTITNNKGYLENKTNYKISDSKDFTFETRRNKKTSLTEFYNLIYSYRNDCLIASLEYNKDFYEDRGLQPEENVFFKLTFVPFGETQTPNLFKK
tara:strand:- start:534 stop:2831 length:2298 start_codon:yes stop_codon:yes gene_type:complete